MRGVVQTVTAHLSLLLAFCDSTYAQVSPRTAEQELARIADLPPAEQREPLLAALNNKDLDAKHLDEYFIQFANLRVPLASLLTDPIAVPNAAEILVGLGYREGVYYLLQHIPPSDDGRQHEALRDLPCSLPEPSSEREWALLRNAALGKWGDISAACAMETLALNGSSRSRRILEGTLPSQGLDKDQIARFLRQVRNRKLNLSGGNLPNLYQQVAKALDCGEPTELPPLKFNRPRDRAIAVLQYVDRGSRDYVVVFKLERNAWRLNTAALSAIGCLIHPLPPHPPPPFILNPSPKLPQ